jgi:sugar O-acyltransferase (sialic acid O-acetyltransferase NeuD family)
MATAQTAAQAADRGAGLIAASLVVLGGGEHARVVIEAARSQPDRWHLQGYAAPSASPGPDSPVAGIDWLGDDAAVVARLAGLEQAAQPWLVLGFAGGDHRDGLSFRLETVDRFPDSTRWGTVIHASASMSPSATIEPGAVVLAHAVVNARARVLRHALVNSGAIVEHDVTVGVGSHIAPGAVIGGGTYIGERCFIGLGARVRDHVDVGDGAVIGMGAVVVDSVGSGDVVVGVPARRVEPRP